GDSCSAIVVVFQAEDGIRHFHVTGVQTCALPILGQSVVAVGDDSVIKVHIHTENPGEVLQYALGLGYLDQIKIDNMSLQTEALRSEERRVGQGGTHRGRETDKTNEGENSSRLGCR